ncbi:MAG: hypothetical protein COU35_01620 [Candidatus Magasanikbacteria bacterium CG10_big_fil_rev_8_21_14_0_10_47_10]|uniref:Polysaccharide chain length determinant N-terminal domain-containing protein n=1 Tax=Candidatus Magasanikbacteria bacterium CG10_big_fil_rev_8_21_14_0_10_47_10 TaxID=1974652 RepID=A0A2H0TQW5_9BACT|nr:MAG: hypothetical protein COU35_01620 [Candidatus Magasanikbacteria bacterium CG10_big_fil_rev_8_21_14_0_10_47_10]
MLIFLYLYFLHIFMFHTNPARVLKKRSKVIFMTGVIVALVTLLISLLFPLQYRADAQVLIISQSRYGVDPYTVVRSAERVGQNISQVVKTTDFFEKVVEQRQLGLDTSRFENVPELTRRQRWEKTIDASVVFGTGVLNVSAYHTNQEQARRYATAAVTALVEKGWEYVGGDVTIKVVNDAVVSKLPVRPNLLLNTVLGFLVGAAAMAAISLRKKNVL